MRTLILASRISRYHSNSTDRTKSRGLAPPPGKRAATRALVIDKVGFNIPELRTLQTEAEVVRRVGKQSS